MTTDLASVTAALARMDRAPLEAVAFAATQQHIRSCELVRSSDHQDEHPQHVEYADEATIRERIGLLRKLELAEYVAPLALAAEILRSTD